MSTVAVDVLKVIQQIKLNVYSILSLRAKSSMELEIEHMGLLFRDKDLRQMGYLHTCLSMKQMQMTIILVSIRFKIV
ncbi:hypothetical protein DPMN_179929 [Dreissena polymorpha]|uniref:Uncharacterized protein n=1 Tax=Dreissena polymorpha TaxID=45954 RepID=A0A9D4EI17_DREPO|nr:hypothetical protein DPMN_179929 [Dreissena polymorpha]